MTKKLTKDEEAMLNTMLCQIPGYRWLSANQHLFDDVENMDAMQSATLAWKAFRYCHLNRVISGNYASKEALKERWNGWMMKLKIQAQIISRQTNVPYEKVFSQLYERMAEDMMR